jgi:2-oxoisovalerate ferredoxin oxidoreductase beta subunit
VEAQRFVRDEMAKVFPVANFRDRTRDATPRSAAPAPPSLAEIPALLGLDAADDAVRPRPDRPLDLRMRVAGFGGQGVLTLGYVLAEAGMEAGYQVSWLPSYGPEMRSGTSNCHVRLSDQPIASPLVSRPNVLLALNEPSLRKFLPEVEPGGIVLYNSDTLPEDCARPDLRIVAKYFSGMADQLGDPKVGNIVMLGALLEATGLLEPEQIAHALRALVKNKKYLELDLLALELGQEELRRQPLPACDDDLWGV